MMRRTLLFCFSCIHNQSNEDKENLNKNLQLQKRKIDRENCGRDWRDKRVERVCCIYEYIKFSYLRHRYFACKPIQSRVQWRTALPSFQSVPNQVCTWTSTIRMSGWNLQFSSTLLSVHAQTWPRLHFYRPTLSLIHSFLGSVLSQVNQNCSIASPYREQSQIALSSLAFKLFGK